MTFAPFERVALIGLGLIGSSLSLGMQRGGLAREIVGTARSEDTRRTAEQIGLVSRAFASAGEAVDGADLVILCVPVGVNAALAKEIGPHLRDGAIVTDVGSVKMAVIEAIRPHIPDGVWFVAGHPISGSERTGPEAGFAELFDERWCVLTPDRDTDGDRRATERLTAFWRALGSNVEIMDPAHHDLVLAVTSHLPHLIAYNIVNTATHLERVTDTEVIKFSAGGFRDFTRIAASDPTMWRDVFLNNREATLEMLGRFSEDLSALQRAIRYGDGDAMFEMFSRAQDVRRGIIDAGQDTAEADFGRRAVAGDDERDDKRQADAVGRSRSGE